MVRQKNRAPHAVLQARPHPNPPPAQPVENPAESPLAVPSASQLPLASSPTNPGHTHLIKTILVLAFALRYQHEDTGPNDLHAWTTQCRRDFELCPSCFDAQLHDYHCFSFENRVQIDHSFVADFVSVFQTHRRMRYASYSGVPAVIKHVTNEELIMKMRVAVCENADEIHADCDTLWREPPADGALKTILLRHYSRTSRPGNVRVLPSKSVARFIDVFGRDYKNKMLPVVQLSMNPEAMIMRTMHAQRMAVPRILMECGFLNVQSYEGRPLVEFYGRPFFERLQIARNILDSVLKFTLGVDEFRIYLTDATADNIVVNPDTLKVSFVDLDGVVIVDCKENPFSKGLQPTESKMWEQVHRHEPQACVGCFSYSEAELVKHYLSDHNIYAVCSLFVQDLYGNKDSGFLHSVPASIYNNVNPFQYVIRQCMLCGMDCKNRFEMSRQVMTLFDMLIANQ